jgi:hypothetical protein
MKSGYLGAAVFVALLAGCGGGGSDNCHPRYCTASSTLATSEMKPFFRATRHGDRTELHAWFADGNEFRGVRLTSDRLIARTPGVRPFYFDRTDPPMKVIHEPAGSSREYTFELRRPYGKTFVSSVTLPPAFTIVSPASPLTITRSTPPVQIVVTVSRPEDLNDEITLSCGSNPGWVFLQNLTGYWDWSSESTHSIYLLDPSALYQWIQTADPALDPTQCDAELKLIRSSHGSVDTAFMPGGRFDGYYETSMKLVLR